MQVKAKIVNENNEPLPGANVVVLNAIGQPTIGNDGFVIGDDADFDGIFSINNAAIYSPATLLKISYVGYKTIIIPVDSIVATAGVIKMNVDSKVLSNTDVYGKKKSKFNWWWIIIPIGIGTIIANSKADKK